MAKTLEELKEAIDNIIVENGKGEITASTLNMLLHDMSDTLSELGSSGGGQFDLYCNFVYNTDPDTMENAPFVIECTEEQKKLNKQIYDKIANGERCPLVLHSNDIQDFPVEGAKMNISSTCIYFGFMTGIPDEAFEDMPKSEGVLQFMNYSCTIVGIGQLMLLDSGEIIIGG
jgi:hypothetical protein